MGWLECGVSPVEAEDVAQHSFETAAITMLLADHLKEEEIDQERALQLAIIHDWAEALTGDISREVSSQIGQEVKEGMAHRAIEDLVRDLPGEERYLKLWEEYSEGLTKESKLVLAADQLSVLVEATRLFERGEQSKELDKLWNEVREGVEKYVEEFPIIRELLDELNETHPA